MELLYSPLPPKRLRIAIRTHSIATPNVAGDSHSGTGDVVWTVWLVENVEELVLMTDDVVVALLIA